MLFEIGESVLDVDVNGTRAFYDKLPFVSDCCSCDGCQNFDAAVATLPRPILDFFSSLGIDMRKACEIYVHCANADGTLFYGGFYHVRGEILASKDAEANRRAGCSRWFSVANRFRASFKAECDLLEADFPAPALQIDINADIPWVLDKANAYV